MVLSWGGGRRGFVVGGNVNVVLLCKDFIKAGSNKIVY